MNPLSYHFSKVFYVPLSFTSLSSWSLLFCFLSRIFFHPFFHLLISIPSLGGSNIVGIGLPVEWIERRFLVPTFISFLLLSYPYTSAMVLFSPPAYFFSGGALLTFFQYGGFAKFGFLLILFLSFPSLTFLWPCSSRVAFPFIYLPHLFHICRFGSYNSYQIGFFSFEAPSL